MRLSGPTYDKQEAEFNKVADLLEDPDNWRPNFHKIRMKSGLGLANVRSKIGKIREGKKFRIDHKIRVKPEQ